MFNILPAVLGFGNMPLSEAIHRIMILDPECEKVTDLKDILDKSTGFIEKYGKSRDMSLSHMMEIIEKMIDEYPELFQYVLKHNRHLINAFCDSQAVSACLSILVPQSEKLLPYSKKANMFFDADKSFVYNGYSTENVLGSLKAEINELRTSIEATFMKAEKMELEARLNKATALLEYVENDINKPYFGIGPDLLSMCIIRDKTNSQRIKILTSPLASTSGIISPVEKYDVLKKVTDPSVMFSSALASHCESLCENEKPANPVNTVPTLSDIGYRCLEIAAVHFAVGDIGLGDIVASIGNNQTYSVDQKGMMVETVSSLKWQNSIPFDRQLIIYLHQNGLYKNQLEQIVAELLIEECK